MAQIHNSELTQNMIGAIKASTARDYMPSQLADKVVPVIDVHPNHNKFTNGVLKVNLSNATTASAAFPTNKNIYVTGVLLCYYKDATATATSIDAKLVIGNVAVTIIEIPTITLTAQQDNIYLPFDFPIKADTNKSAYLDSSTNVANIKVTAHFFYYTEEIN